VAEARLRGTLDRHAPPAPVDLVDLGCGTGALLLALRHRHWDWTLTGLDGSAAMIEAARHKRGADQVNWVHAPFEDVRGPHTVAVSFFDALNHAPALAPVCSAVGQALVPGGLFIFDLNNRVGFESWWQGQRRYETRGWTMVMDATFDASAARARGQAVITHADGSTAVTDVTERCYEEAEVRDALERAGFSILASDPWRPMPGDVPGKTWWIARRG
jgi:SAM-dependent methyltransferase